MLGFLIIKKNLKFPQSVDSLERTNGKMSSSVGDFWDTLPAPAQKEEGELLVLSADGKGMHRKKPKTGKALDFFDGWARLSLEGRAKVFRSNAI